MLRGVDPKEIDKKYNIQGHIMLAGSLDKKNVRREPNDVPPEHASGEFELVGASVLRTNAAASLCWWCRHRGGEGNPMVGIPIREEANIREIEHRSLSRAEKFVTKEEALYDGKSAYVTEGHYCSYECRLARIRDQCLPDSKSEELLARMLMEDKGIDCEPVQPARHWHLLKIFGGSLRREELYSKQGPTLIGMSPEFKVVPLCIILGQQR